MKSPKDRVREAMERHHSKLLNKNTRGTKNKKPEKDVERFCLEWMRSQGWDVQIMESKATYNPKAGMYLRNTSVSTGTCDCIGTMPDGKFVAIEFKAPGRLSTFASDRNHMQRDYIISKIRSGAFAAVVDSVARLEKIHAAWQDALLISIEKAKDLLLGYLPNRE